MLMLTTKELRGMFNNHSLSKQRVITNMKFKKTFSLLDQGQRGTIQDGFNGKIQELDEYIEQRAFQKLVHGLGLMA